MGLVVGGQGSRLRGGGSRVNRERGCEMWGASVHPRAGELNWCRLKGSKGQGQVSMR